MIQSSSGVEQATVNRSVVGSKPTSGVFTKRKIKKAVKTLLKKHKVQFGHNSDK